MGSSGYAVCLNPDNTLLASPFDEEVSTYASPVTWMGDTLYGVQTFSGDTALYAIGTKGGDPFNFGDRPSDHPERIIASVSGQYDIYITTVNDGLVMSDGGAGLWKATFADGVYQSSETGLITDPIFSPYWFIDSRGRPQFQLLRNDEPNLGLASVAIGQAATQIATWSDDSENVGPAYDGIVVTPQIVE